MDGQEADDRAGGRGVETIRRNGSGSHPRDLNPGHVPMPHDGIGSPNDPGAWGGGEAHPLADALPSASPSM